MAIDLTEWPQVYTFLTSDFTIVNGASLAVVDFANLGQHRFLKTAVGKLRWGARHLAELEENITQTFTVPAHRAKIRAQLDAQTGYHVFRVSQSPDIEGFADDFSNSVGDVAKNLHPALDKFVWQLACEIAPMGIPRDAAGVHFPIAESPDEFWGDKEARSRKQLLGDHWTFLEQFQPYNRENGRADSWSGEYVHPLTFLRLLSNDDKHRVSQPILLLPQTLALGHFVFARRPKSTQPTTPGYLGVEDVTDDSVVPDPATESDWYVTGIGEPLEADLEVMRARLLPPAEPEIEDAGLAVPQVSFSGGRHAVATLQRVARFVHFILSEFAREFPST